MYKRSIFDKLNKSLSWNPVVLLTGARQTGKTTLMKEVCNKKNYNYVTFDDLQQQTFAKTDPIGYIKNLKKPVIIDEIQRVPEIFLPIKKDVDENREAGRYALTGSANPLLIPKLGDSLAGRMGILQLYPLSQGEINGVKEKFVDNIFKDNFEPIYNKVERDKIEKIINIGGYPSILKIINETNDWEGLEFWFNSYLTTILQRDVKDIANIADVSNLSNLLSILATRSGNLVNISDLSRISKIPNTTLNRYLSLFDTIFLVDFLKTWSNNLETRLVKSPKVYLNDTGLLSYLLGVSSGLNGQLLENFVVNEIQKQISWAERRINLHYFRNNLGIEVDIVLEDAQGNIVCLEIKSSNTISPSDFKGIKYLREKSKDIRGKFISGIVIYLGNDIIKYDDNLLALPISALWG